jgi:tetratricopeptide (TPR) repeat protein
VDEASKDIDRASILEPNWGVPWFNGALVAMERDDFPLADKNARQAMNLGEKSVRIHTLIAEAQLMLGRPERAEDELELAFQLDPFYPYALLVKAKLDLSQGRSRDAERALTQALAAGPEVAVESRLAPRSGSGSALGGTASESHLQLFDRAFSSRSGAFRLGLDLARQLVEDRSNADQTSGIGGITVASSFGTFHLDHYQVLGGKPGATSSIVGIPPNPGAYFTLEQTHGLVLKGIPTGGGSTLWLHGNYRQADVRLRMTSGGSMTKSLEDEQRLAELRWDLAQAPETMTQLGAAYATLDRSGSGPRPLEPSEQVFPIGDSKVWTAYLLHRRPLAPRVGLTVGVLAGSAAQGNRQIQPLLDIAFKATDSRTIHLRATPRFNDSISNLIPLDVVADTPQRNLIDRNELSTTLVNRSPVLQGTRSEQIDFELTIHDAPTPYRTLEAVIFHRDLDNVNVQGADSRIATSLALTPVTSGSATGIEGRATFHFSHVWSGRLLLQYQRTTADFRNPTLSQGGYPGQVPQSSDGMPNFPTWQAMASLDYAQGNWLGRFVMAYVGRRPTALSSTVMGSPVTYLGTADAQLTGHFYLTYKISPYANAILRVFNIGEANFYPGYPGSITSVLGYEYRF